jgi:hypothetical protein
MKCADERDHNLYNKIFLTPHGDAFVLVILSDILPTMYDM